MSLIAASLMKSSVFGAIPRAELTPVFSPADCPNAGPPSTAAKVAIAIIFLTLMIDSFRIELEPCQLGGLSGVPIRVAWRKVTNLTLLSPYAAAGITA
jgi:hypothetical protein